MKTTITVLIFTLALTNCRSISSPFGSTKLTSATTIPPGKTFNLGGTENGAFSAWVRNVGSVVVAVSQRQADGRVTALGQLQPGDRQTLTFTAGSTALFVNASSREANLYLELVGDTNLKMGYAKGNN